MIQEVTISDFSLDQAMQRQVMRIVRDQANDDDDDDDDEDRVEDDEHGDRTMDLGSGGVKGEYGEDDE